MLGEKVAIAPLILEQLPRGPSRHQLVVQRLCDAIAQGRPAIGERLPSERELCEQLGVSRTIVREAIRVLAAQGVLTVRQGRRAVVTAVLSSALPPIRELIDAAARQTFEDVMDARLILETAGAERAARRATADDIAAMAGALEALRSAPARSAEAERMHAAFHRAIAHASHNHFLAHMIDSLLDSKAALRRPPTDPTDDVVVDTPLLPMGYEAHARIFRPIQDRREAAARRAMHDHLSTTVRLYPSLDH